MTNEIYRVSPKDSPLEDMVTGSDNSGWQHEQLKPLHIVEITIKDGDKKEEGENESS